MEFSFSKNCRFKPEKSQQNLIILKEHILEIFSQDEEIDLVGMRVYEEITRVTTGYFKDLIMFGQVVINS